MAMISEMLSTMPAVKVGKLKTMGISGGHERPGGVRVSASVGCLCVAVSVRIKGHDLNQVQLNSHHSINF
jgi:hypothetical protein